MTTSIINLLMEATETQLKEQLIDGVPVDDPTRAGLVQTGRLLDDPTITAINVMVYPGDEDWLHELNTYNSADDGNGIFAPTASFGNGYSEFWRRRWMVELKIFFEREVDYDTARDKANIVLSRSEHAVCNLIRQKGMVGPDSFKEGAVLMQVRKSYLREGGGDGEFNWRGFLYVQALTERHFS